MLIIGSLLLTYPLKKTIIFTFVTKTHTILVILLILLKWNDKINQKKNDLTFKNDLATMLC